MTPSDLEAIEYAAYVCDRIVHALYKEGRFAGLSANDITHLITELAEDQGATLDHALTLRIVRGILAALHQDLEHSSRPPPD